MATWNQYLKIINEVFDIFSVGSWESGAYLTLTEHLDSDLPYFKCSAPHDAGGCCIRQSRSRGCRSYKGGQQRPHGGGDFRAGTWRRGSERSS